MSSRAVRPSRTLGLIYALARGPDIRNCLAISTPLKSRLLTGIYGLVPRAGSRTPEKPPDPSTRADDAGGLAWGGVGELGIGQSGNLEVEIDAVEQEARGRGGRLPPGGELEARERPRFRRPGRRRRGRPRAAGRAPRASVRRTRPTTVNRLATLRMQAQIEELDGLAEPRGRVILPTLRWHGRTLGWRYIAPAYTGPTGKGYAEQVIEFARRRRS